MEGGFRKERAEAEERNAKYFHCRFRLRPVRREPESGLEERSYHRYEVIYKIRDKMAEMVK